MAEIYYQAPDDDVFEDIRTHCLAIWCGVLDRGGDPY
jgi:hypothetical protein